MRKVLATLAVACALAACGVVDNPETTPNPPNLPPSAENGIAINLHDFTPYAGQQIDVRLVGGDGTVLGVYRTERLALDEGGDYRLELASVPKKPESSVDLLIDEDGDGVFEPESEPAWSKPLVNNSVAFFGDDIPSGAPDPEQPGGDFSMSFTGFGELQGELLRVALINPAGQITGLFTGRVQGDEFDVELPQVVVDTQPYTLAIFADASGNGRYDVPPADAAWFAYATGSPTGIAYVFSYNEDFEDVGF